MSLETMLWLRVGHTLGFIMWVGSLIGTIHLVLAASRADQAARGALTPLAGRTAMAMDIGATIAIVFGLALLFGRPGGASTLLKGAGFFHLKLALLVALVGVHGFARVGVKKLREGRLQSFPAPLFPVVQLLVIGILVAIIVRPFCT